MHRIAFGGNYGLSDFIPDLPSKEKIKEFFEKFKLNSYYGNDKKLIIAECRRQNEKLNVSGIKTRIKDGELTLDSKSGENIIEKLEILKITDFTGNGWDDSSTKAFRGRAPYDELIEEIKDMNESFDSDFLTKYGVILTEGAPPATPPTPPSEPAEDSEDKDKSELYRKYKKILRNLIKELESEPSLAVVNKKVKKFIADIDAEPNLPKKEAAELKYLVKAILADRASTSLDVTTYFIAYYVDIEGNSTEDILKRKVLDPNVANACIALFSGTSDVRNDLDNLSKTLCDNYSSANDENLNGLFAICTGNLNERRCKLYIPKKYEVDDNEYNDESDAEIDETVDEILDGFSLPSLPE